MVVGAGQSIETRTLSENMFFITFMFLELVQGMILLATNPEMFMATGGGSWIEVGTLLV